MAINLKKIARDLKNRDADIRMLALTTILQLTKAGVENAVDLIPVYDGLREVSTVKDQDMAMLAQKGMGHLRQIMEILHVPIPASAPAQPATQSRVEEFRQSLYREADPTALASLLGQAVSIHDEEVLRAAASLTRHKDPQVRARAVEVVGSQADERRLIVVLLPLLADPDPGVRTKAASALMRIGPPRITEVLLEMTTSQKATMREVAVWAIGHLKGDEHIPALIRALKDPVDPIRVRAIRGLSAHQAMTAVPALASLTGDVDPNISQEAIQAIDAINGRLPPKEPLFDLISMARAPLGEAGGDKTTPIEPSTSPVDSMEENRKKAQEELARIEKILSGESPKIPRVDVVGKSREELLFIRDQHLIYIGQMLTQGCRGGQVQHPEVNRHFYDFLKYQELLNRRRETAKAHVEDSGTWFTGQKKDSPKVRADLSGHWFTNIRSKLSGSASVGDTVAKLEQRIQSILLNIGQIGLNLMKKGEIKIPGADELIRRIKTLTDAIEQAKGGGPSGND